MAQKRMFDKTITNSDSFLDMPVSTQNLYFHLSMNADDDGFIDNWKSIIKMTSSKEDDLRILVAKSYVIPFENGVIVIKHWRINNFLRKDRYKPTKYFKEFEQLSIAKNQEYELKKFDGQPMVNPDKNSIEENNILTTTIEDINSSQNLNSDNDLIEVDDIYSYLEKAWGRTLNSFEYQLIEKWEDNEITRYAIKESVKSNARNINYVESIIRTLTNKGIKTEADAIAESERFKNKKNTRNDVRNSYRNSGDKLKELEDKILRGEYDKN